MHKGLEFTTFISGFNDDFSGKGVYNNRILKVWNALPGEQVKAFITKKTKGISEAVAFEILKKSPLRLNPKDKHFLSCSPLQILPFDIENELKRQLVISKFNDNKLKLPALLEITADDKDYGYRTKMEFSFTDSEDGISLALFKRGLRGKVELTNCALALPAINKTAEYIVKQLRKLKISSQQIKSAIIRTNLKGETISGIFLKEKLSLQIKLSKEMKGIAVYYSDPKSPASIISEVISTTGDLELEEEINGYKLKYGLNSFFQNNINLYSEAVKLISDRNQQKDVLDFYSGVGSISMSITDAKSCILVDSNAEAITFAKQNIKLNKKKGFKALTAEAEKALELIESNQTLIVDPPRVGLQSDLLNKIKEVKPAQLIYLSCNIESLVKNLAEIKEQYTISNIKMYNFFPHTPHFETLVILKKVD